MGVILYALLFGKLPFNGNSNSEVSDAIVSGNYDLSQEASRLSKNCIACLKKTLELDPTIRITSTDL
jgi:serine/threonine protein kinase